MLKEIGQVKETKISKMIVRCPTKGGMDTTPIPILFNSCYILLYLNANKWCSLFIQKLLVPK